MSDNLRASSWLGASASFPGNPTTVDDVLGNLVEAMRRYGPQQDIGRVVVQVTVKELHIIVNEIMDLRHRVDNLERGGKCT